MNNLKIIEQEIIKLWDGCEKIDITAYCKGCKHELLCRALKAIKKELK
jgi:hypothetical protein